MRTMTMTGTGGWVATSLAVALTLALPVALQGQRSGADRAAELEAEAVELSSELDRWQEAADLYLAAAQLRQHEDPLAVRDLFAAANLLYQTGDTVGAISALESAGTRAQAAGDAGRAADMFARAAWAAQQAGRTLDERRLSHKAFEMADASGLSRAERDQILARITG